ncbi:MAG TPA: zinc-binding dehydrogenase, partial [Microlunatus sp.]|nr:zinc-binding dehydrogenase [Microlunatus sp.]
KVTVGDRVIISCISKCMECDYCKEGLTSHCQTLGGIGWIFGHLIDGTQAEYVRVPFADNGLIPLPDGVTAEQGTMLSDILPTGFEIGVQYGAVKEGNVVAVVGSGPVGLAAIMTAASSGAAKIIAVDGNKFRLEAARDFGATDTVEAGPEALEQIRALGRGGAGVDVAIEAVGIPETFELCVDVVRPGGHVANVGVHGRPATLHLETAWSRDLTITTGLVDTFTSAELLRMMAARRLTMPGLITHRFGLDEFDEAYDVFARPADTGALKVALFGTEALDELRA